jgi:hypothetical protein
MIATLRKVVATILGVVLAVLTLGLVGLNRTGKLAAQEGVDPRARAGLDEPLDRPSSGHGPNDRHADPRPRPPSP